jgi:hypothetical protein
MAFFFRNLRDKAVDMIKNDKPFLLLHIGTATGLAGFTMTDPLPLRCCSIAASVSSITYVMTRVPVHSMAPVYWSSCFIAVNSFKIMELLMERKDLTLSPMEEDVYVKHFLKSGMRPRQFKRLMDHASVREFSPGEVIEEEGSLAGHTTVKLLTQGSVTVLKSNEELFVVDAKKAICFLGDLSLLELADAAEGIKKNEAVPSFSTCAIAGKTEPVIALEWDKKYLLSVLAKNSETSNKLRAVLTSSVMQKLIDIGQMSTRAKYITLLSACAADGEVNSLEKHVLIEYAKSHDITPELHEECLNTIGWTVKEYERGVKSSANAGPVFSLPMWDKLKKKVHTALAEKQLEEVKELRTSGAISLASADKGDDKAKIAKV